MKRYFEYPFDEKVKEQVLELYNRDNFMNDEGISERGTKVKLSRILKMIRLEKDDEVCDVGCSVGTLLKQIAGDVTSGLGIDIAESVIANNIRNNHFSNLTYTVYDGVNIPGDKKFDKVFLLDVLEHSFQPDELIKSIYDHIEWGGAIIVTVPSTGWLSELIFGKYHQGHLRYYDPDYIRDYLRKNGFQIKGEAVYNAVPLNSRLNKWPGIYRILDIFCNLIPRKIYPYFGNIVIVAKKCEE